MKISPAARTEFEFLRICPLDMIGTQVGVHIIDNPSGHTALECWVAQDTYGKTLPCRETAILAKVLRTKQSLNLQIKLWAEDIPQSLLTQEELVSYTHGYPPWVFKATMAQASKLACQTIGFSPRFARAEYLWQHLWLPHMDAWDPSI